MKKKEICALNLIALLIMIFAAFWLYLAYKKVRNQWWFITSDGGIYFAGNHDCIKNLTYQNINNFTIPVTDSNGKQMSCVYLNQYTSCYNSSIDALGGDNCILEAESAAINVFHYKNVHIVQ